MVPWNPLRHLNENPGPTPLPGKKSIPKHTCTKGPVGRGFSSNLVSLDHKKPAFRCRRVLKITCSPSSHFSSELFHKVTKKLSKWSSKSPQNTLEYATPKRSIFLLKFVNFLTPQSGPKWSLRAPLGVSWGLSGRAWPHIVPPSASQGCPRDSPGTPKASISTYSRHVFDHRAKIFGIFVC